MEEHVRNCVREHRQKAGMTQVELAEEVGVTRQTIIAIEKGSYTPSVLLALKLAAAFEVRVEAIFECK